MTEKVDFSQLANEDDSLISWEDLFPEYALGGESFKSGQSQVKSTDKKITLPQKDDLPNYDDVFVFDNTFPNMSISNNHEKLKELAKEDFPNGVQVMNLPELPDIPMLTDDLPIVIPEETQKKTTEKQPPLFDEWAGDIVKELKPVKEDNTPKSDVFSMDADWISQALAESEEMFKSANAAVKDQDYWANRFNQLNFAGMDLMAVSYFGPGVYDLFEQHMLLKRVTRDFVRLLGYNYTMELRSAGVSEEGIFYMKKGKIPENFTVHLKYPLEYGGTIDFGNMVLMQDKPFHDMIHSFLDEQMLTPTGISYPPLLYVPTPVGKIYVPFGLFTGSGGKNKQDRSVYAGYSKAAFDKIALRAMPGR